MLRPSLLFLVCVLLLGFCSANQMSILRELIKSQRRNPGSQSRVWVEEEASDFEVFLAPQDGLMEADRIQNLPGQPEQGVDFDHYGGYVTVDPKNGRALFYYFVESPLNSSSKPLVLWLNGGPGCSSLGYGAMEELGPFRVNSDGKTLYRNNFAWNNVANVIFLESPAGVGFSYSNTSSDYITGDKKTAQDSYTFLLNWLERFPQYKTRDFYLTGESYAGHYIPQLASIIISKNKNLNKTIINLKGIAIGNAWIDDNTGYEGTYDYYWTHGLNSDETNAKIHKECDFVSGNYSDACHESMEKGAEEVGNLDPYNIYAPFCNASAPEPRTPLCAKEFDPCSDGYVWSYLNRTEVQSALHAKPTNWAACRGRLVHWTDMSTTILPTIKNLMASGIRLWLYSGDVDSVVSITATRYAINTFKLPVTTAWRAWYASNEVGGYVEEYKGLTLVTVRGSGHTVPSYQPERALIMISSFLQGKLPPPS